MIYDEINKIPKLPQQIVDAINENTLAIFIGAGVSRIIGCASWEELTNDLIKSCFSHDFINFKEKEALRELDPKKKITICNCILKENELESEFVNIIKEALKPNPDLKASYEIYDELYLLRGIFVTTNADDCFSDRFERIVCKDEDFKLARYENKIDRSLLYNIHGSISEPSTLVFTVPQYLKKYNTSGFKDFMVELFSGKYVILFVGYGLEEFEVLDYLITKFNSTTEYEKKHFILLAYYKSEKHILDFDRYYYDSLGITVLPYEKDEKGYNQLYEVIKDWSKEINQLLPYLYNSFDEIDKVIANFDKLSAKRIFQIIKNDEPQRNHFFEALASCDDPFPWLKPLTERNYFDPKNNPHPIKISEKDRYYFEVRYWSILGYLKNLATKNVAKSDAELTKNISQIIDSIFEYRDKNGMRIENYRTDSILIDVIFKLPVEMIEEKHIIFIENALKSKINKTFITSQIYRVAFPFLISNKKKDLLLKLLNMIFNYEKSDTFYKYSSMVEDHWLSKAVFEFRTKIAELCGMNAAEMVLHKIEEIVSEDETQFRTASITTIENSGQNLIRDKYAYQFVSFVRDIFESTDPEVLKPVILDLLSKSHPIFRRIAIHTISYHYNFLNKIFWELDFNPIDDYSLKHEIYELLSKNCLCFSADQLSTVTTWIESANYYADNRQLSYRDKYLAYNKKYWFFSIIKTNDPNILSLYLKYDEINPKVVSHPGDLIHIETYEGDVSPINESELLTIPPAVS
jgi:hypothetical protein